jgi:hypothetical protein
MRPTYLYLKKHNQTGLMYFGKTVRDPESYTGSGVYWTRHLEKHGNDVSTLWTKCFTDKTELTKYALNYSKTHNIVESNNYANLKEEDGLMGGDTGITEQGRMIIKAKSKARRHTEETKARIRDARRLQTCPRTGKKHSYKTIQKIKEKRAIQKPRIGYSWSDEQRNKFRSTMLKRPRTGYSWFYSWSDEQRKKFQSTILERKFIRV